MFLKDVESWLKRGQYVRFLREICPPKKMYPQNWRQYWRHNRNPVNEYIIPQEGGRFVVLNLIRNIQLVQQTQIQHTMNYTNILDYCWIITTCDVDIHSITIGENYKNVYGVTHIELLSRHLPKAGTNPVPHQMARA
jgi:hypothetical protein